MSESAKQRSWDDYLIPGTPVLRNKFTAPGKPYGEPDPVVLRQLEEGFASSRIEELQKNPLPGNFDYAHMKAIHHYIFQDVYEWAGQERTAPSTFMTKNGYPFYPAGPPLTIAAETEYRRLAEKYLLRGLQLDEFVTELAESWGEINVIHSFREGNTRAQFVFFTELTKQAGYELDAAAFAMGSPLRDEFVAARFHSQASGNNAPLAAALKKAITPIDEQEILDDAADLEAIRAAIAEDDGKRYTHDEVVKSLGL